MSVDDKLARLAEQKLIAIKNFHLDLMRKADRLRLPDNYIKGTGNNKAVMGDFNNPLNPLNNGINPNTNTCTAIPQNAAGFYGRPACLSERPTIIPMTQSEGAHTSDASANGTESDIFSRSNGGIDFLAFKIIQFLFRIIVYREEMQMEILTGLVCIWSQAVMYL